MFVEAVDKTFQNVTPGENGTLEYIETGESRVELFFALVRNIPDERLKELMDKCLTEAVNRISPESVADMFVLTMQTRDCRGGKGERDLFYKMLLHLNEQYPATTLKMLGLLDEYGYYKDFFRLLELMETNTDKYTALHKEIIDIVAARLRADEAYLENNRKDANEKMSLCAKYAPREGKRFEKAFDALRKKLFPDHGSQSRVLYRKLIVKLAKALDVPEIKMCAKRYRELSFAKVPSVCAAKFRKAFLNEKIKTAPKGEEEETGNRFPLDEDRVQCRKHLREAILNKAVKGKQLYPHEIVTKLTGRQSVLEADMLDVQWTDIRNKLLAKLVEAQTLAAADGVSKPVDVGKLVPLVDVSGSMSGIPMEVAIALGILISEINHPSFRDRLITFESSPSWVSLSHKKTIAQKVEVTRRASWGGSTNIEKAFQLIRDVVVNAKLPVEEVPDLIIFSDMQFDQAVGRGAFETQLVQIRKMFHDAGMKICGQPYPAPKIIFWNLRGDTVGFPAEADSRNVQMLSGYSPSLLRFVLEGEPVVLEEVSEVNADGETVVVRRAKEPNPYDTLRKVLDDPRYDAVRAILDASEEGMLVDYHYTPVAKEEQQQDGPAQSSEPMVV